MADIMKKTQDKIASIFLIVDGFESLNMQIDLVTLFPILIQSYQHICSKFNQLGFYWEFGSEAMFVIVQDVVLSKVLQ